MAKITVAAKVKQTLANLKGAQATLENLVNFASNPENKAILEKNQQRIGQIIGGLEKRVQVLEFEEPQYKGF